jgi:predicted NBD/HSP70 family sugar kinase
MTPAAVGTGMTGIAGAADHAVMRRVNRAVVLDFIRSADASSRASIAEATGLAKPTVSLIVDELMSAGLVSEIGRGASGAVGGRPPVLLAFNSRSSFLAGVHVGVRRTTVVVADALGEPLAQHTLATPDGPPERALEVIAGVVADTLGGLGAGAGKLSAVGICLPGLVSDDGVLLLAPNLGWRDVAVAQVVGAVLGAPVVAHNAARTSLLAETHLGAAKGERDVLLVYAGTGVGAAAVVDGHLMRGAGGVAGEFGHVRVRPDGRLCACGKTGCLETVASAEAVAAAAAQRWGRRAPRRDGGLRASDVAAAAAAGDPTAQAVLTEAGRDLGAATAWLVNVFDPACLVLAGGLAGAGPAFVEPFRDAVLRDALDQSVRRLRIVVSELGQEAEVRGVLLLAREHASADVRIVTQ